MQLYTDNQRKAMFMRNSSTASLSSLNTSFSSDSDWDASAELDNFALSQRVNFAPSFPTRWGSFDDHDVMVLQAPVGMSNFETCYGSHYTPFASQVGLLRQSYEEPNMMQRRQCSSMGDFIAPQQTTLFSNYVEQPSNASLGVEMKMEVFGSPLSAYHIDFAYESPSSYGSMNDSPQSSVSPCTSTSSTPSRPSPLELLSASSIKFELHSSSLALQEVQGSKPSMSDRRQLKCQRRRKITNEQEFHEQFPETNLKRSGTRKHPCSFPMCDKRFERTEHVKRHEATVHNSPKFNCQFCKPGDEKRFPHGRRDNYKDHLKRHLNKASTRTIYNPAAQAELDDMNSKAGRRTKKIFLPHRSKTL